jgi:hypothetical protein
MFQLILQQGRHRGPHSDKMRALNETNDREETERVMATELKTPGQRYPNIGYNIFSIETLQKRKDRTSQKRSRKNITKPLTIISSWIVHNRMESLRHHVSRLPPNFQQLLLVGLIAPIGVLITVLFDLSRRLHGPHPQAAQLNPNYNEDDLDRVSYADIDMLNAIPHEPTHAGYVIIGGSGFVGRCALRCVRV